MAPKRKYPSDNSGISSVPLEITLTETTTHCCLVSRRVRMRVSGALQLELQFAAHVKEMDG